MKNVLIKAQMIEAKEHDFNDGTIVYPNKGLFLVLTECRCHLVGLHNGVSSDVDMLASEDIITVNEMEAETKEKIAKARSDERQACNIELKKLQMENDNPKKNGFGEWISGRRLADIIRILMNKDHEKDDV
mgnify:CR=1 FL=1